MAKDNLLRDAIADAKAVKETALANAMLVLKESFRPQLTSLLTTKLREEADITAEQKDLTSSGIGGGAVTVKDPGPKAPASGTKSSSDIENHGLETDTFGEGLELEHGFDEPEAEKDIEIEPDGQVDMQAGAPQGISTAHDQPHEMGGEAPAEHPQMGGGEDELDLEAIIRELEADLHQQGAAGQSQEALAFGERDPHVQPESFKHAGAGTDVRAGLQAETLEGSKGEGIEKDGKARPSVGGVPSGKEVKAGQEIKDDTYANDSGKKMDEEVDLDEIMREIAAEDSVSDSDQIANENVELKHSLQEHREVIKLLRNRINEVTLLNSKLMYTTKIFRGFNLSESQKKRVVEQFDRATTLREAKIVYTVLAESLNGKKSTGTSSSVARLTEGVSRVVASTKPKTTEIISEGTTQVERMKKLAGIIKS